MNTNTTNANINANTNKEDKSHIKFKKLSSALRNNLIRRKNTACRSK